MVEVLESPDPTPTPEATPTSPVATRLPAWCRGFVAALGLTGCVSKAARAAGISSRHANRVRRANAAFAQQCTEALQAAPAAREHRARQVALGQYLSGQRGYVGGGPTAPALAYDLSQFSPEELAQLEALARKLSAGSAPPCA